MAYEELFLDLLRAEREEDVTDALTVFGLEKFSDSNWLPYGCRWCPPCQRSKPQGITVG